MPCLNRRGSRRADSVVAPLPPELPGQFPSSPSEQQLRLPRRRAAVIITPLPGSSCKFPGQSTEFKWGYKMLFNIKTSVATNFCVVGATVPSSSAARSRSSRSTTTPPRRTASPLVPGDNTMCIIVGSTNSANGTGPSRTRSTGTPAVRSPRRSATSRRARTSRARATRPHQLGERFGVGSTLGRPRGARPQLHSVTSSYPATGRRGLAGAGGCRKAAVVSGRSRPGPSFLCAARHPQGRATVRPCRPFACARTACCRRVPVPAIGDLAVPSPGRGPRPRGGHGAVRLNGTSGPARRRVSAGVGGKVGF